MNQIRDKKSIKKSDKNIRHKMLYQKIRYKIFDDNYSTILLDTTFYSTQYRYLPIKLSLPTFEKKSIFSVDN